MHYDFDRSLFVGTTSGIVAVIATDYAMRNYSSTIKMVVNAAAAVIFGTAIMLGDFLLR